tara:strand:- start:224 stop:973 length:750 start_codon:yes stop_codon:yes gene_type:complete
MSKLYIFTVRDVREDGKTKYNGMIPKLFSTLYDNYNLTINDILNYNNVMEHHTHESLFKETLSYKGAKGHQPNLLHSSQYLSQRDKQNIEKLNMLFYKNEDLSTKKKYLEFYEHLFKGHSTMQYGLYFGSRKADNEKDFLDSIQGTKPSEKNQSIIYYTNIETLIDYIDKVKGKTKYDNSLLYFNETWQYGKKEKSSIDYKNNKYDFICHIRSYPNKILELSEIICQVPLPIDLFKHSYKKINESVFKF